MFPFSFPLSPPRSDLIATGGSAAAAGELISKCGGKTLEYLFIVGLGFLNVSCIEYIASFPLSIPSIL